MSDARRPSTRSLSAAHVGGVRPRDHLLTGNVRSALFVLALPVLGEQMLNTCVGIFDTFLAGRIGTSATNAIGLAAYVAWLVQMLVMLVATATTALVARNEGADAHDDANHVANQSLGLAAVTGAVATALIYLLAPPIARLQGMTGETYAITVEYLRIESISHMFTSVTLVGCAALRGVGNTRTPMLIFVLVNGVNMAASVSLVYGLGPLPALGVTGIVSGTVIARVLGAVLTIVVLVGAKAGIELRLASLPIERVVARRILKIGVPAAADGAVMWAGHFIFLMIIARLAGGALGEAYYAAHIVAVRVEALTYLPAVAWGVAAATMIGQALGAGDRRRARRVGHEAVLQCGLLAVFITVLFLIGAPLVYRVMHTDPLVRQVGTEPFRILALFQPLLIVSIVYIHSLRGAGDTRFPLLITIVGVIVVRLPLGALFGLYLGGGLLGAWVGMMGDMTWRAAAALIRFVYGRWDELRI